MAFNLLACDDFSRFFKGLAILGGILALLLSERDPELFGSQSGTYAALILFSIVGTLFLASAEDLLMLFIGLELTSLPLFILAGFLKRSKLSGEGAVKFFLMGAFSSGIMVYGMSLLYGLCGSSRFSAIRDWFLDPANAPMRKNLTAPSPESLLRFRNPARMKRGREVSSRPMKSISRSSAEARKSVPTIEKRMRAA
jgi:NADH-quinone oxidoreductase subunit N